ncbi:hypothetical protein D3C85_1496740 [compost metagenome]
MRKLHRCTGHPCDLNPPQQLINHMRACGGARLQGDVEFAPIELFMEHLAALDAQLDPQGGKANLQLPKDLRHRHGCRRFVCAHAQDAIERRHVVLAALLQLRA